MLILNHLALDICIPEYLMSCLSKEDSVQGEWFTIHVFRTSLEDQMERTTFSNLADKNIQILTRMEPCDSCNIE